jgi:hypothetical protein
MDSIKARSQVRADEDGVVDENAPVKWNRPEGVSAWEKPPQETAKVSADVQSAKLKQLLGQIKQS